MSARDMIKARQDNRSSHETSQRRRELLIAILLCAVGATVVFVAGARTWVEVEFPREQPLNPLTIAASGRDLDPAINGLPLVGLAAILAIVAGGKWGRWILGLVVIAAGLFITVRALTHCDAPSLSQAETLLSERASTVGVVPNASVRSDVHQMWPVMSAFGGALMSLGGYVILLRGTRWPVLSGRYSSPGQRQADSAAKNHGVTPKQTDKGLMWDALDRGRDPTVEEPE